MIDLGPTLAIPVESGHYVYRHLDVDGVLLYVGQTSGPIQRTASHVANWRTKSYWWDQVRSIEWERHATSHEAIRREWELIEELQPPHNFLARSIRIRGRA